MVNSRDRLLAAAAREFAARGYDGASVDRIARAARLNKAMIYYHFKNKAGLYRAIVRDVFTSVRDAAGQVAAAPLAPEEKIRGFVASVADMVRARPHFPPIWLGEFAAGARNIDAGTLAIASDVVGILGRIIAEGRRAGRFRAASPLFVHIGIIAPILLFLASGEARARLARAGVKGAADVAFDQIVAHVTEAALGSLCVRTHDHHA